MSELQKQKQNPGKILDKRWDELKEVEQWVENEKTIILEQAEQLYDEKLKVQPFTHFSLIRANNQVVDEQAALAQYILENNEAENLYMSIQERKLQTKNAEDELVKDALRWFATNGKEIPKKTRKAYLKAGKGGMQ